MIRPGEEEKKITGPRFEELRDAVDLLYIRANLSGRTRFLQAWPAAALYIFGSALVKADTEGTEDREGRALLEQEAETRRVLLLALMGDLEEKTAPGGVLEKSYVQNIIDTLGKELAALLYAPAVMEKMDPSPKSP